jgi:hypothetical protein
MKLKMSFRCTLDLCGRYNHQYCYCPMKLQPSGALHSVAVTVSFDTPKPEFALDSS